MAEEARLAMVLRAIAAAVQEPAERRALAKEVCVQFIKDGRVKNVGQTLNRFEQLLSTVGHLARLEARPTISQAKDLLREKGPCGKAKWPFSRRREPL